MCKRIKNEQDFLDKFERLLSNKFTLTPFDYSKKLENKVELTCKVCEKKTERLFYNLFKSDNCLRCVAKEKANERHKDKWMSKEEFIKLLPLNVNYKVLDERVNLNHSILVEDAFGICKVSPRQLTRGSGTSVQNAINKTDYRINLYRSIHGDNFSYPNFEYRTNNSSIDIICNRCGREDTIIDCNHIKKGTGCKTCDTTLGTPRMDDEDFLQRVINTGSNIEILEHRGEYHTPILCKNKYGLVKISPDHLLKGSIGSFKSAVDKTSYKIEQFKEKHGNKYTYPNYEYCGNRCDAKIECTFHGEFTQSSDVHLMGSGCTPCSFIESGRVNGHSRTDFIINSKGRECILYIVKMADENEQFYKIGITSHPTEYRFKKASDVKYDIEIIHEHKSFDAGYIWDLEKEHHRKYKEFHYKPEIYFKGITECFTTKLPIEEIISYLKQL